MRIPDILKCIKTESWKHSNDIKAFDLSVGVKTLLKELQVPFDAEAVAKRCVANPNSKYFGMDWKEVVDSWSRKFDNKCAQGSTLDDYIGSKLLNFPFDLTDSDSVLKNQAKQFDRLYDEQLSKLTFIGRENWLCININKVRIRGKFDALFGVGNQNDMERILVIDWKQNDKIDMQSNKYLLGPMSKYMDCKHVMMTLQIYVYRYILETYGVATNGGGIGWISETDAKLLKLAFPYDSKQIKEVLEWCTIQFRNKSQQDRNNESNNENK